MKKTALVFLASMLLSPALLAEVVVIGHPSSAAVDANTVRDIYLNRSQAMKPFELPEGNAARTEFHEKVTGRNDAQLKAFWSQQVFTGRGTPPQTQPGAAAMKAAVASSPGAIGYIDAAEVDDSVKVLLKP